MAPMGLEHGGSIRHLNTWLSDRRGQEYILQCQVTIQLAEGFTPDPDFVLLNYREGEYRRGDNPQAGDVLLVIEIADASLQQDLEVKSISYARANVPELWVVDIPHRGIHRLTQPTPEGYQSRTTSSEQETISPEHIPNLQVPVKEALPATEGQAQ